MLCSHSLVQAQLVIGYILNRRGAKDEITFHHLQEVPSTVVATTTTVTTTTAAIVTTTVTSSPTKTSATSPTATSPLPTSQIRRYVITLTFVLEVKFP